LTSCGSSMSENSLTNKATILIAANSLIALFLFSVSVQNVDLATPLLQKVHPPPSIFTSLVIGLFTYGSIITAFRSIYTLYRAIDKNDGKSTTRFETGYRLFVAVIIGSILLICSIALSFCIKVADRSYLPWQPNLGPGERFCDFMLLIVFYAYVAVVILKPNWIATILKTAGAFLRRLCDP